MKFSRKPNLFLGLILYFIFSNLISGCLGLNENPVSISSCLEQIDIDQIACDNEDAQAALTLKAGFIFCLGPESALDELPHNSYTICRTNLIRDFKKVTSLACQKKLVEPLRCLLKKQIKSEAKTAIQSAHTEKSDVKSNLGKLKFLRLATFLKDLGDWYKLSFENIYKSKALFEVKIAQAILDQKLPDEVKQKSITNIMIDNDQSEILDLFWTLVLSKSKTDEMLQAKTDFFSQNAAALQIAELAVLQKDMPIPLVMQLVGDSLTPLSERLNYLAQISDLGCKINSCQNLTNTELYSLISLLGTMANPTEFEQRSSQMNQIDKRLKIFFEKFKSRMQLLKAATLTYMENEQILDTTMKESENLGYKNILDINPNSVPYFARQILKIVQTHTMLANSYLKTGFYNMETSKFTEFGFGPNLDAAKIILESSTNKLNQDYDTFIKTRADYSNIVLAEATNATNAIKRLDDARQTQLIKMRQQTENIDALRIEMSTSQNRYLNYAEEGKQALNNKSFNDQNITGYFKSLVTSKKIKISPADAPKDIAFQKKKPG